MPHALMGIILRSVFLSLRNDSRSAYVVSCLRDGVVHPRFASMIRKKLPGDSISISVIPGLFLMRLKTNHNCLQIRAQAQYLP